jgi:hypothetical protein
MVLNNRVKLRGIKIKIKILNIIRVSPSQHRLLWLEYGQNFSDCSGIVRLNIHVLIQGCNNMNFCRAFSKLSQLSFVSHRVTGKLKMHPDNHAESM